MKWTDYGIIAIERRYPASIGLIRVQRDELEQSSRTCSIQIPSRKRANSLWATCMRCTGSEVDSTNDWAFVRLLVSRLKQRVRSANGEAGFRRSRVHQH